MNDVGEADNASIFDTRKTSGGAKRGSLSFALGIGTAVINHSGKS